MYSRIYVVLYYNIVPLLYNVYNTYTIDVVYIYSIRSITVYMIDHIAYIYYIIMCVVEHTDGARWAREVTTETRVEVSAI